MSEAQLDDLLKMVRTEFEQDQQMDMLGEPMLICSPPTAANDNAGEWPLLPFPDGWTASC